MNFASVNRIHPHFHNITSRQQKQLFSRFMKTHYSFQCYSLLFLLYKLSVRRSCPIRLSSVFYSSAERKTNARLKEKRYLSKDRKSTRLNSSHANISYAVFC